MKPASFDYHAPRSIEEVVDLLGRYGGDGRILAGGQSLVPLMNMRMASPDVLISINHCPSLAFIGDGGDGVEIGAGTRQIAVEKSDRIGRACRLLRKAMPFVGSTANRNRGTVCGSLAHADPSAELPAVAVALDAQFLINGPRGERRVGASDFFVSELTTCIEADEYLQSVTMPVDPSRSGSAFTEVGPRAHGFAIAGVAARVELDSAGRCREARLAGIGFAPCAIRIAPAERLLAGSDLSPEALLEAGNAATAFVEPGSDIHADAAYRKHLAGVLVVRALQEAAAEARGMAEG